MQQCRGSVAESVSSTLTGLAVSHLQALLPCIELALLGGGTMRCVGLFGKGKVEIQVQSVPHTLPDTVPFRALGATRSCPPDLSGGGILATSGSATGPTREGVVVQFVHTLFAVPDFRGIVVSGAEDVDCAVTGVTIHGVGAWCDVATHDTRFLLFEQIIVDDQRRINVGLLLLILNCIRGMRRRAKIVVQFDDVEIGTACRAAVRALDPRSQAGVVKVVATGEEVGDDLIVLGGFAVSKLAQYTDSHMTTGGLHEPRAGAGAGTSSRERRHLPSSFGESVWFQAVQSGGGTRDVAQWRTSRSLQ